MTGMTFGIALGFAAYLIAALVMGGGMVVKRLRGAIKKERKTA